MLKKIKLGLSLVKYGFRPGTNLTMCILFIIIGLVVEVASKGTNIIGGFYVLLTGMFVYQMIISMDLSCFVQTTKMKKALQTTVPVVTGTLLYLVIYTLLVIEKAILIKAYPENVNNLLGSSVLLIVLLFGAMVYTGFCYKYFVGGTIFYVIYVMVSMPTVEVLVGRNIITPTFLGIVIFGYAAILLGGVVEYLLSCALYKKDISKFAFRGIFGKIQ